MKSTSLLAPSVLLLCFGFVSGAFAQAPTITTQPANRAVTVGATATFSVVANATSPTYQWRKNGANIAGATAASYTTPVTTFTDNGSLFSVVVSSGGQSVTSNNATLTVNQPATIDVNGPGGVAVGTTATFTTVATLGTPPYTYQWYKNGTQPANLIVGATSASYTTPPVVITDSGSRFYVRITDASNISVFSDFEELSVFKAGQTITFNPPTTAVVSPTPITLTATASSGLPVTFSIEAGPATVVGSNLTLTGVGIVSVRAAQGGDASYDPAFVSRPITVSKGTPVISWSPPATINDGTVLGTAQLNATANVAGTFVYSPPSGTVARSPSVSVTATFTPTDTTNYNTATATRTIAVGAPRAAQTITFNPPANPVVSPTPIALSATASSGLPVSFIVLSGPATLSGDTLLLTGVGSVSVRAFQNGNTTFEPALFIDRTFTVGKGTPVITWSTPSAVPDGTSLGSAQLNATANVPGTFVYSPASGTVVRAPSQVLNVTFTPSDTINYNNASAQRTLIVGAALNVARLTNVSVRTTLAAAQILIVGFTMTGGEKQVLVRAVGPTLSTFGISAFMADPRLTLFKDSTPVQNNDNWGGDTALVGAFNRAGAFALPATSADAALIRNVDGGHTAQVLGPPGTVLVEVYDIGTNTNARLSNLSARNRVGTGSDILIAGFTIEGSGQKNLLLRAIGPALAAFDVRGVLVDPKLELYNSSGARIAENDSWAASVAATFNSVGAFALPTGSRDAALTIQLPAGNYTVQVAGADGGTGEALVEIYELP